MGLKLHFDSIPYLSKTTAKFQMIQCKDICSDFLAGSKVRIYEENGCFCRNCNYFFKKSFLRCPCCNGVTRHNSRKGSHQKQVCRI